MKNDNDHRLPRICAHKEMREEKSEDENENEVERNDSNQGRAESTREEPVSRIRHV